MSFQSPLFLIFYAQVQKIKTVLILQDLGPIFERHSKITNVINDSVRCYKEEALEKSKKVVKEKVFEKKKLWKCSKLKQVVQKFIESVQDSSKKYIREFVLFRTILNRTIPEIVQSEFSL